jgi:hypothetical protein
MEALFEATQPQKNTEIKYPKQICSVPHKNILGKYIRTRLGLPLVSKERRSEEKITRQQLLNYGCDKIKLKLLEPGVYSADFSPKK